jgi:hypothetical protein
MIDPAYWQFVPLDTAIYEFAVISLILDYENFTNLSKRKWNSLAAACSNEVNVKKIRYTVAL